MPDTLTKLLVEGFVLGWSVAWPPGPINAELIRRALGRGFLAAFAVALGASSGDALWAVVTATGARFVFHGTLARLALGFVSTALLFALAFVFLKGAWQGIRTLRAAEPPLPGRFAGRFDSHGAGYALGLGMALTSPWNLGFWLAVMGRPDLSRRGLVESLIVAGAVVLGALTWCVLFCGAVSVLRLKGQTVVWEIVAKGATGLLMLVFALMGILRLGGV